MKKYKSVRVNKLNQLKHRHTRIANEIRDLIVSEPYPDKVKYAMMKLYTAILQNDQHYLLVLQELQNWDEIKTHYGDKHEI